MNKFAARFFMVVATFFIGILSVIGWFYYQESQKNTILLPKSRWEKIFFRSINNATKLSGLKPLRDTGLVKGDIEIRVWRGFGLDPLEGVVIRRTGGEWTGLHIRTDDYSENAEKAEVKKLNPPKSGWESFWKRITDRNILGLPDSSVVDCGHGGIDGMGYVVEINQDKVYRTYKFASPYQRGECLEADQLEEIGDIIGEEFDSGTEQCKRTEWFACTRLRRSYKE